MSSERYLSLFIRNVGPTESEITEPGWNYKITPMYKSWVMVIPKQSHQNVCIFWSTNPIYMRPVATFKLRRLLTFLFLPEQVVLYKIFEFLPFEIC